MSRYRGGCSDPTCEDCQQEWGLFPEPERRPLDVADKVIVQLAWGDKDGTVTALFELDGHPMVRVWTADGTSVEVTAARVHRL